MAYCVYFDFTAEIKSIQKIWKFKTPDNVEWRVRESWVLSRQGIFPRASLSSSLADPQRFAHEICLMRGDMDRYYAKIVITTTAGWHPTKQLVKKLDLSKKSIAEIPFADYKNMFIPRIYIRPVVLRCTINLFPLFHVNLPECIPLTTDINDVPTLKKNDETCDALCEDMVNLLNEGYHSDVVVRSGSLEKKAHKNILSTRSPVFTMMIEGFTGQDNEQTIQLLDMEEDVFQKMLSFIYSGKVDLTNASLARRLYIIADKYEITDLKNLCSSYLQELASVDDSPV